MSKLNNKHTNGEWLEFLSDLEDTAALLEDLQAHGLAETVLSAREWLIEWNPERKASAERGYHEETVM